MFLNISEQGLIQTWVYGEALQLVSVPTHENTLLVATQNVNTPEVRS